jgi:superfamily I DNA/RNA helicase
MEDTWWRRPEELDVDQTNIISLPLEGSHLVVGPPGSGKTNLLLLRASYLWRAGVRDIVVVTFTRMLKEFLATGTANYPFEPDRIQTYRSWAGRLLKGSGRAVNLQGKFPQVRARLFDALSAIPDRDIEDYRHDVILLDEAQDYSVGEIDILRRFSREIFAVGDNRQRIYEADGALDRLAEFCECPPPLRYHYRNGLDICRFVDGMRGDENDSLEATCNYDEAKYPSSVNRIEAPSLAAQVTASVPIIETQLRAYPDQWIGIMTPLKGDPPDIYDLLIETSLRDRIQLQRYDEGYTALDPQKPIIISTMHSAKGLEYRAAHLMAFETIVKHDNERRLAFTAATRAKTSLTLYHSAALPGYVERGLQASSGEVLRTPSVEELFGGSES